MSRRGTRDWSAPTWRDAAERLTDGMKQALDFQRRVFSAGDGLTDIGDAYARFVRSDLAAYGKRVARLTFDYYRALGEAAREYGEHVWEDLRDRRPPAGRPGRERTRHTLEMSGPPGTTVTRTFTLENTDDAPAHVTVTVGVCRAPDGSASSAPVTVHPDRLTIEPGRSAAVTIEATMDPALLEPDVEYVVPIDVTGPRPTVIELRVRSTGVGNTVERTGSGYTLRCPRCGRTFERKTPDVGLRAHKTPEGKPCPGRSGKRL